MSVTPEFLGQKYTDSSTGNVWNANSTTAGDWTKQVQDLQLFWTPTNVLLSERSGCLHIYGSDTGITTLVSTVGNCRTLGIDIEDQASLTSISLPDLVSVIEGTFMFKSLDALTAFSAPLLVSVLRADVEFVNVGLTSISLP